MARDRLEDTADVIVVGTGAGGATAAHLLAAAGHSVIMLEEGPLLTKAERPEAVLPALAHSIRDMATETTSGSAPIPLLSGRMVGGGTALNSGIIWRMPEAVRRDWIETHGLAELVDEAAFERIYDQIETDLEVAPTAPDVRGGNAAKMAIGAIALGLKGEPTLRNARRCEGRARCLQGCPGEARQSMDVTYIPRAIANGARLMPMSRAVRIIFRGGRAVAVEGEILDRNTRRRVGRFTVHARHAVVVAAGAIHSPLLLLRSGLRKGVGHGFTAHPGTAVVGRFPDPVGMGYGATQSYQVPLPERSVKLESLSLPPEMLAARIPGAGAEWQGRLTELDHYAQWAAVIRADSRGRVHSGFGGRAIIDYPLLPVDLHRARDAAALLCRMMFAAGATEVYPGIARVPDILRSERDVAALDGLQPTAADFHFMASHHFGTAHADADPSRGVVDENLAVRNAEGLYVMDASVFPTNLGVNPQHAIMAVTYRAAERLGDRLRDRRAA